MKQVVLRVDDAAFEKFMGMVSLCPQVEVLNIIQISSTQQSTDVFVATAIRTMRNTLVFRSPCDYAYLMVGVPSSRHNAESWTVCWTNAELAGRFAGR